MLKACLPALCVYAIACESPPTGLLAEGPTLIIDIAPVSASDIEGRVLSAAAPVGETAQAAHGGFLAANAGALGSGGLVVVRGARVSLRPGLGVNALADAWSGLMIFVAPECDPTARVFLASAVAPATPGPAKLVLTASRAAYEGAQVALRASRFVAGVSGPTPLSRESAVEFGLRIELDTAISATGGHGSSGGGHGSTGGDHGSAGGGHGSSDAGAAHGGGGADTDAGGDACQGPSAAEGGAHGR